MSDPNTDELVRRAQAGDQDAYDRLFGRVAERVLLYSKLRLGAKLRSKVDPVDVLQDTYLEAHKHFPNFELREEGAFARWLCRIVDNRIRHLAEHFGAKKRTPPRGQVAESQVIARIRAEQTGPATASERQERHLKLIEALDELSPEEQQVVLGKFFEGRTIDHLAGVIGRSPTSVRRLLEKALSRLGRHLPRS